MLKRIALGADHRGFLIKEHIKTFTKLGNLDIEWVDRGTYSSDRTDYPVYGQDVARLVQSKLVDAGVLICGTGNGMGIAANRFSGVYASLAWNIEVARLAKEDDNSNVLVLPADFIHLSESVELVTIWLTATFKEDRYRVRLEMIDKY